MAFTFTQVDQASPGGDMRIWDVVTLGGDVAGSLTHNLPFTPEFAFITPMDVGCYSQSLFVATLTGTVVTFTKGGGAVATFRLVVGRTPQRT